METTRGSIGVLLAAAADLANNSSVITKNINLAVTDPNDLRRQFPKTCIMPDYARDDAGWKLDDVVVPEFSCDTVKSDIFSMICNVEI